MNSIRPVLETAFAATGIKRRVAAAWEPAQRVRATKLAERCSVIRHWTGRPSPLPAKATESPPPARPLRMDRVDW